MAESYSVEAYLKATGASQFINSFRTASKSVQDLESASNRASVGIGRMVKTIAAVAATVGAFHMLNGSLDGAIKRYDTLSNFPRVLQLMGFDAAESEKAIKKLSDGIDGLPTTLDSVASTTQRIALMTGDLDGAVETTLALNNAFLASGASTADAARGLEQYVQMMATGTVDLQSWRTLQETMPVALNKVAEAFGYTGKTAQNELFEALKNGEITFDEFNKKLIELNNTQGGFAELAREASTGIATSWQNIKTNIVKGIADMIAAIDEGLARFGGVAGVLDRVKEGIRTFFGVINANIPTAINLFGQIISALKSLSPIVLSVGTAFLVFNSVINIVNRVKMAMMTLRVTFMVLKAAMLANPIALIIGLLAGLAVMFIHLWNTSETFRQGVTNAFNALKDIVMPIVQEVVDFIMQIVGQLVDWWQQNGDMIIQAAENVWSVISSAAQSIWSVIQQLADIIWDIMQALWPVVKELVITTWEAIKGAIEGAIEVITGIIQFFAALFTGDWEAMWEAVKQILSGAIQLIWNFIQLSFIGKIIKAIKGFAKSFWTLIKNKWDTVKNIFTTSINLVKDIVSKGFNTVKSTVSTVLNAVRSVVDRVWNGISSVVSTVMGKIKSVVSSVWDRIKSIISTVSNNIKSTVSRIFNSLKSVVSDAFDRVVSAVRDGMTRAYNAVKNKVKDFFDAGKNIVSNIADGIKDGIGKVTGAISDVADKIRGFLPFSPAKEGPLRDIMNVQIAQSIAQAIDRGRNVATQSMRKLSEELYGEMPNIDIAGRLKSIHARSKQMRYDLQNELTVEKQPAYITLVLGNREFEAFVEDINEINAINATLRRF